MLRDTITNARIKASEVDVEYTYANIGNDGTSDTVEEILGDIDAQFDVVLDHLDDSPEIKHAAEQIGIENIPGATYDDLQDYINIFTSASLIEGGMIIDSTGGEIDVESGIAFIKITDSEITTTKIFDFSGRLDILLTDNDVNHVYVDYNSGNPQILVTLDELDINGNTQFELGHVYRDGDIVHIVNHGPITTNFLRYLNERLHATGHVIDGLITTETGTRNIHITAGAIWAELTKYVITEKNTSVSDTFIYHYHSGGTWIYSTGNTQIDNTQYDDGTDLATLSKNDRYGVHWVYMHEDGDIHIVYGQGDYKLAQAQDAIVPPGLPSLITDFGALIAKIVINKNDASFTSITYPFDETFPAGTVDNHNDLGGLQGGAPDENYHLTSSEYTNLDHNTLDNAYDEGGAGAGRVITADSGPVKIDRVASTDASLEIVPKGSLPSTNLADGQIDNKGGIVCVYDNTRTAWLSIARPVFCFGRSGRTRDQYLNFFVGTLASNNSGIRIPRNATIVSLTSQLDASGSCTFQIKKNDADANIASLDISSNTFAVNTTVNVDVEIGDFLQCSINTTGFVEDPVILIELAWRP